MRCYFGPMSTVAIVEIQYVVSTLVIDPKWWALDLGTCLFHCCIVFFIPPPHLLVWYDTIACRAGRLPRVDWAFDCFRRACCCCIYVWFSKPRQTIFSVFLLSSISNFPFPSFGDESPGDPYIIRHYSIQLPPVCDEDIIRPILFTSVRVFFCAGGFSPLTVLWSHSAASWRKKEGNV